MKKYKLIKVYPDCVVSLGDFIWSTGGNWNCSNNYYLSGCFEPKLYPEFWEEIKEPKEVKNYEILSFKFKYFKEDDYDLWLEDRKSVV